MLPACLPRLGGPIVNWAFSEEADVALEFTPIQA
jgi:hypothetical protein